MLRLILCVGISFLPLVTLSACAAPPTEIRPHTQNAQGAQQQRKCPCATLDADELNVIGADAVMKRNEHAQAAQVYDAIVRDLQAQIGAAVPAKRP